jgi:hypothetical protein
MIAILERDFIGHQIIIASIYDYSKKGKDDKTITMDGKLLNLSTGQMSLFDTDDDE